MKPTFRGKMNVGGRDAAANDSNSGVKTNYDFGVVYSTKRVEGEGGERTEGDGKSGEMRYGGGQRKPRDHGTEFGKEKKTEEENDDNDFTIVRDAKTRVKKTRGGHSSSDDEAERDSGRGGYRGGFRDGGDRGGFRDGGDRGGFRDRDQGGERGARV